MIFNLQTNQKMMVQHYDVITTIYVRQFGAGNLRLASKPEDLEGTIGGNPPDGIPQVAADGKQQYFWSGDLWLISDAPGAVLVYAPSYMFYIDRLRHGDAPNQNVLTDGEIEGNLSTYPIRLR